MKLNKIQLKHIFVDNKIVLFAQIKKFNSKELLIIKQKLLKKNIELKVVSNEDLKFFFSNIKKQSFLNLFKGEIVLFFSKTIKDCFFFYEICKSTFDGHFFCWYILKRFYFFSNLILRNKNLNILDFLNVFLFNKTIKFIFFLNRLFINLMKKQLFHFFNILEKTKNAK